VYNRVSKIREGSIKLTDEETIWFKKPEKNEHREETRSGENYSVSLISQGIRIEPVIFATSWGQ
jgi:hypothetical protein